jgi:hypothetical protein
VRKSLCKLNNIIETPAFFRSFKERMSLMKKLSCPPFRFSIFLLAALTLPLGGCSLFLDACGGCASGVCDSSGFNSSDESDRTLFRGHQSGELKRHADDWANPVANSLFQ